MKTIEESVAYIKYLFEDVKDKAGNDYWLHPYEAMVSMGNDATDDERHAMLLHDVVEDLDITENELAQKGYNRKILDIVRIVTKDNFLTYPDWIQEIIDTGNKSAIKVKKYDIKHNLREDRLALLDKKEKKRLTKKYTKALEMINSIS